MILPQDPPVVTEIGKKPKRKYNRTAPFKEPTDANRGEQVTTLAQLCALALERKSVFCPNSYCWRSARPAAFIQNQLGVVIHRLIQSGMFVYIPNAKTP